MPSEGRAIVLEMTLKIPVNTGRINNHWTLIVVILVKDTLEHYDCASFTGA